MNDIPNLIFYLCPDFRGSIMKELGLVKEKKILFKNSSHPHPLFKSVGHHSLIEKESKYRM